MSGNINAGGAASTISPGGTGSVGTLYAGSLNLNNNVTMDFSDFGDQILLSGALNFTGTGAATLILPGSVASGIYKIIGFSTPTSVSVSNFSISGSPAGFSLLIDSANNNLDYLFLNNFWQGSDGGNWNDPGSWTGGSVPNAQAAVVGFTNSGGYAAVLNVTTTVGTIIYNGVSASHDIQTLDSNESLVFDNTTGAGKSSILISTTASQTISAPVILQNTDLSVSSNAAGLTFSGAITESGGSRNLTVAGGLVIFTNTGNNYSGGTNINGGTLQLGASNVMPDAGTLTVAGGVLDMQGNSETIATLNLTSGTVTGTGAGTLAYTGTVGLQSGVLNVALSGSGAIAKTTPGTVVVGGANYLSSTAALSQSNGVLNLGTNSQTVASLVLTGGTLAGSGATLTAGTLEVQSGLVTAGLGSAGGLLKLTAGTVILSGIDTYSGNTTVTAGTLKITQAAAIPSTFEPHHERRYLRPERQQPGRPGPDGFGRHGHVDGRHADPEHQPDQRVEHVQRPVRRQPDGDRQRRRHVQHQ